MADPVLSVVELEEKRLRTATWGSGPPEVVMLHDGLGSIPQWRDVPAMVAAQTGRTVMAYERSGHGESEPVPTGLWPTDWLHREAVVLDQMLTAVGAERPVLVGHSDGGSIALLCAATTPCNARAVLSLAAHSWVEDICFESIVEMRANRVAIEGGLARYHSAPHEIFEAWSGVWVSDAFRSWDVRDELGQITVPTMVAQGSNDAYASESHARLTAGAIGTNATAAIIPELGHIMHHDDPDVVAELIAGFVATHVAPIR